MMIGIIGMIIGCLVIAFGLYYLIRERDDQESRKIYGIVSGIGGVILIAALLIWVFELL